MGPGAQHAGPPAALIGREIERLGGGRLGGGEGPPAQVGRITYEILRSVPIARLRVEAEVVRPGGRVELVQAALSDEEGEPLVRAQGSLQQCRPDRAPPPAARRRMGLPGRGDLSGAEWRRMADTRLLDESGQIGRAVQTLLVAERETTG